MAQTEAMSEIKQQALVDINEAQNEKELQDVKVKYLGKKGSVTGLMKHIQIMEYFLKKYHPACFKPTRVENPVLSPI